MDFVYKVLISS